MRSSLIALAAIIVLVSMGRAHGATIGGLWNSPSRLTAVEAAVILLREADGESPSPPDLFEARKHLRTDGGVSMSAYVVADVLTRLLAHRVGTADTRIRTLAPVMHWLEGAVGRESVRLRGETLQLSILNDEAGHAATVLRHETVLEDWRLCDGVPCVVRVAAPLRSRASYVLSVPTFTTSFDDVIASDLLFPSSLAGFIRFGVASSRRVRPGFACDPPSIAPVLSRRSPSSSFFRHSVEWTTSGEPNRILCAFRVDAPSPPARLAYLVDDRLAVPPASAMRSAVVNNPLDFTLDVSRR